jgi:hypothetical protein
VRVRRVAISVGLCLLLLFVQRGALVHELGHLTRLERTDVQAHALLPQLNSCALCEAYLQFATAVPHAVHLPAFEPAVSSLVSSAIPQRPPANLIAARIRGPPVS